MWDNEIPYFMSNEIRFTCTISTNLHNNIIIVRFYKATHIIFLRYSGKRQKLTFQFWLGGTEVSQIHITCRKKNNNNNNQRSEEEEEPQPFIAKHTIFFSTMKKHPKEELKPLFKDLGFGFLVSSPHGYVKMSTGSSYFLLFVTGFSSLFFVL